MLRRLVLYILCVQFSLLSCAGREVNDPEKAFLHLQVGTDYLKQGNLPLAFTELLSAEKLDPENPVVHNNLGIAFLLHRKFSKSKTHLQKAIDLNPKYTEARNNLGKALMELGLNEEAISQLEVAIKDLTYQFPEKSNSNLGIAYFRVGNYSKSLTYLKESLRLRSSHCLTSNYFGRSLFELKKYDQAAIAFDQASASCRSENLDEPVFYGAMAYFKLQKTEEANARFKEVLSNYPNGAYSDQSVEMIKLLEKK